MNDVFLYCGVLTYVIISTAFLIFEFTYLDQNDEVNRILNDFQVDKAAFFIISAVVWPILAFIMLMQLVFERNDH